MEGFSSCSPVNCLSSPHLIKIRYLIYQTAEEFDSAINTA